MANTILDYRQTPYPDIVRGAPVGRGYRFALQFNGEADLAVGDNILIRGKVPADEHWYVLQWYVSDATAAAPAGEANGWKVQLLRQKLDRFVSPTAINGSTPPGPWTESTATAHPITWARWWDGVTYVAWDDDEVVGIDEVSPLIVRCTDPVWSLPRWDAGMEFSLESIEAEQASGFARSFVWIVVVIRYRLEDYDFKRLVREDGPGFVALNDLHMQQHRPVLGQ